MENEIDIAALLRDAPRGMKLWSPIFGDVAFHCICYSQTSFFEKTKIWVEVTTNSGSSTVCTFDRYGKWLDGYRGSECTLWPSKDHRTWVDFKLPKDHKTFVGGSAVLVPYESKNGVRKWCSSTYSHWDEDLGVHIVEGGERVKDWQIRSYDSGLVGKEVSE